MLQGVLNICTKTESQAWKGFNSSFVRILKKKEMIRKLKSQRKETLSSSLYDRRN